MDALDFLIDIAEGKEPVQVTVTNEDLFIHNFTSGGAPRLANLVHFVRHQMYIIDLFNSHDSRVDV